MNRTCVDCPTNIDDRPLDAYLCKPCAKKRGARARKAYYASHPKGSARYNRSVGTEVLCPCGEERFIKKSGSHKFGPLCQAASKAFHSTVWNARHPERFDSLVAA